MKTQMTFSNETEKIKAEIKMLQKKLDFLEELEKTKSSMEEAYNEWYGEYPPTSPDADRRDIARWHGFQAGYNAPKEEKVSEWQPTPQTPEQVADGLKEAFREAIKQGVVSSVDNPTDDFMDKMVAELKGQTLYDVCMEWWIEDGDTENCIEDLVSRIEKWLPTEHDTNSYKWNECIKMIREKLR